VQESWGKNLLYFLITSLKSEFTSLIWKVPNNELDELSLLEGKINFPQLILARHL
jgi:hypothetical protein